MNKNHCWMIPPQKIVLVYIYPLNGDGGFADRACTFVASYVQHPPELEHETVIVCNGAVATETSRALFNPIPRCSFLHHDNSGWDIGGFQAAARAVPCDLMVFCGANAYFRKPGWLPRMVEVAAEYGDTLYGSTGNQGDTRVGVYPHVRTTGFWCSPKLMADFPHVVTQPGPVERYAFEHGQACLSNWVKAQGKQPWIAGWDCVKRLEECDSMPNGFHQGDQSNIVVGDRLTAPPYYPHP